MVVLNIRINGVMTPEKNQAIELINSDRVPNDNLGIDEEKWLSKLEDVFKKFSVKFNFCTTENNEVLLIEEGYIEPVSDGMTLYNQEIAVYNNIKASHELGLVTDEELADSKEYMLSLYPAKTRTFKKREKPEIFEKFRR